MGIHLLPVGNAGGQVVDAGLGLPLQLGIL